MTTRTIRCQGCGARWKETEAETLTLLKECVDVFGEAAIEKGAGEVVPLCDRCYQEFMKWEMEQGRNARSGTA